MGEGEDFTSAERKSKTCGESIEPLVSCLRSVKKTEKKRELDRLKSELDQKYQELYKAKEEGMRLIGKWGEELKKVPQNSQAVKELSKKYIPLLEEAKGKAREAYGALQRAQDAFDKALDEELEALDEESEQLIELEKQI